MVFLQFFFSLFIGNSLAISYLHSRWNVPPFSPIWQIKNAERLTRRLSLFCRLSVEVTPTVLLSEKIFQICKPLKCLPGDGFNLSFSTFQKHKTWQFLCRLMVGNPDSRIREILACGVRNPWNFYLWNLESWALESGIQLQEFGISLMIGIRNPPYGIQNPKLSWIPLHWAILLASHAVVFRGARFSSLPTNTWWTENNIPFPLFYLRGKWPSSSCAMKCWQAKID